MKRTKSEGPTVFTTAQGITVFTPSPTGQQFLHRPDILRKEQQRSHRSHIQNTNFKIHNCRPSVVPTIKEGGEGAGGRPGIGVTKISKPPILSHS